MRAYFDPSSQYLTIDVGALDDAVDTIDIDPGASVVVDGAGTPISIEVPGTTNVADSALRAVARRWPRLDAEDLIAAAHAAHAAPDRDVTVSARSAV